MSRTLGLRVAIKLLFRELSHNYINYERKHENYNRPKFTIHAQNIQKCNIHNQKKLPEFLNLDEPKPFLTDSLSLSYEQKLT